MKKKILIFGGSGFIGKNLILRLLKKKVSKITYSSRKKINGKFSKKIDFVSCDISKKKNLKIFDNKKFDIVINLSGNIDHKNKKITNKIHDNGCKNIIKFFLKKKIKLFIQAGSSLEYGNLKSPHYERSNCLPISDYGKAKYNSTKFIEKLKSFRETKFIILRFYQVYGPHQKFDRLIPFVIKNSLLNKRFKCSPGEQLRDFLFIDDLTELFLKILKKRNFKNGIYNVGYGSPIKVKRVIEKIVKIINKGKPLYGALKMRKDEPNLLYPNINKIKKIFKWRPRISLNDGLKRTIKFYEQK